MNTLRIQIRKEPYVNDHPWNVALEWSFNGAPGVMGLNWFATWEQARDYALMERRHFEEWNHHEPPC